MNGEGDRITLSKRDDLGATLHAWPLFGQDKLPAGEIRIRLREEDRNLDRKEEIAIEILMEAVEVTGNVLQQQRRRPHLAGIMASLEKRCVFDRIPLVDSHAVVPLVGDVHEARIERRAQPAEKIGQRILEVAVLALAEAMSLSGRKAMEWFMRKTSIAGNPIPNWALVLAALVVIWFIYAFAERF